MRGKRRILEETSAALTKPLLHSLNLYKHQTTHFTVTYADVLHLDPGGGWGGEGEGIEGHGVAGMVAPFILQ